MKESIVLSAWEMVTRYHSLKKLNFLPSFFGMLWLMLILIYQLTFTYVYVFQKKDDVFSMLAELSHKVYFMELIVGLVLIFFLYIILEPIARGGMIQMMDTYQKWHGKKYHRSWQGLFDGLGHFLPIFEVHNLTAIFRPLSIITFYILLLRVFGIEFLTPITVIMSCYLIFSFFLNMCFSYADFFIIFEKKWAVESLSSSTGMAVRNIGITSKLYFTMILLYLRTIFVGAVFLLLPFALSSILAFFTLAGVKLFFLIFFLIVAIVLFIFIVHLNSTLEIFVQATWYEAYLLCKEEDKAIGYHDGHDGDHGSHGHDNHGHH